MRRSTLSTAAFALAASLLIQQSPAMAQSDFQAELTGYHVLCDRGDRRACIKFGMLLERHRDMVANWRRSHTEWFWWER